MFTELEFKPWPKIPRLMREIVVTEKIDGTNASVQIERRIPLGDGNPFDGAWCVQPNDFAIRAGSRTRWITPENDNHSFAKWVEKNAESLIDDLGEGHHFGEWWGLGIQRGYGLKEKRFSLFNTSKWEGKEFRTPGLGVVTVLYRGMFNLSNVIQVAADLIDKGSASAPGFIKPEGVVVFHTAANQCFKYTFEGDGHKGEKGGIS